MKSRRLIAWLLCGISILMLAVAVFPHHHHNDELPCMRNDLRAEASCCDHHHTCTEHCCCNTGCLATHIQPQQPQPTIVSIQPTYAWAAILCNDNPLLRLLSSPASQSKRTVTYQEALHSVRLARFKGLRAPPSVLA